MLLALAQIVVGVALTDGTEQQATVQAELHVRRTRRLRSGCGDVLADVRRRDENLGERNRVVRKEEKAEQVFSVRILVDDTSDVNDETNGKLGDVVFYPL